MLGLSGLLVQPAAAAPIADERLRGPDNAPLFVIGMNYEGPADRAWRMWEQGAFDPGAIDADFGRAAAAGATTLRIFVQAPLVAAINAGHWDMLDRVVDLAESHGLTLDVSLHDYGERDLGRVSAVAGQIAGHYRGRKGILAFDLKNEPRFGDLALTLYANPAPLQTSAVIDALGERLSRADLAAFRASDDGARTVPASLPDDQAWVYVNNLRLYREMLAAAADWVKAGGYRATTLDYLADPAAQSWAPLVGALNGTLDAWISPQLAAIRKADPDRLVTLDHVDVVLASLPANDALDLQSLHRYPSDSGSSIRSILALLARLQTMHARPYLLSEFGFATETVPADRAAVGETAITLGLAAQHAAGGIKWMLNDMPPGYNMRERTLGAFTVDGTPKPVTAALSALRGYLASTGAAPGELTIEDDAASGVRFVYRAADAVLVGGKDVDAGAVHMVASGPAELFVTWTDPAQVRIWASAAMDATIDVGKLVGGSADVRHLTLAAGSSTIAVGSRPARGADFAIPGGHFFTQTNGRPDSTSGFSVTDEGGIPFWTAFSQRGGIDVLGYPVSRRFTLDGFTVQAFQKTVLQWHPDQKTFAYLNTFDVLHDRGRDDWLETYRQTPRPLDTQPDAGLAWPRIVERHVALLDGAPAALRDRFLSEPDWLEHFGLPVAVQAFPSSIVVRAQRATLQYWTTAVPWAAQGTVSVANGGDLAKEAGLFPWLAVTPENAPR